MEPPREEVRAMALAELTAAVHEETARCTALIRDAMSGNLCRCGTYHGIQQAIAQVAQKGA
jgi:aerobic-type carbon monoxide dehydrogenase small subunit (CoxS/CutS family)